MANIKRKLIPGKLRGRPPVYTDDINVLARRACRLGATNAGLADFFSVSETTINDWIADKPAFAQAVFEGREYSDAHVAECLYARATGYDVDEEKLFYDKEEGVVRADVVKHYPPDVEAIRYWLNNRQRGKWTSKAETEPGQVVFNGPTQINDNRVQAQTVNIVTLEEGEAEYSKLIGR